jgi:hypothetical protein
MGLFTFILIMVIVLAVIGIGWETFSVGVINGFERVIDVAKQIVNDPTLSLTNFIEIVPPF